MFLLYIAIDIFYQLIEILNNSTSYTHLYTHEHIPTHKWVYCVRTADMGEYFYRTHKQ